MVGSGLDDFVVSKAPKIPAHPSRMRILSLSMEDRHGRISPLLGGVTRYSHIGK